ARVAIGQARDRSRDRDPGGLAGSRSGSARRLRVGPSPARRPRLDRQESRGPEAERGLLLVRALRAHDAARLSVPGPRQPDAVGALSFGQNRGDLRALVRILQRRLTADQIALSPAQLARQLRPVRGGAWDAAAPPSARSAPGRSLRSASSETA